MKYNSALLAVALLLTVSLSYAQTISESGTQMKWQLGASILNLPNDEAVITAKVSKKDYALLRIDNNAREKWKYDLKELDGRSYIVGIGRFQGNILVLIANDASDNIAYSMVTRIEAILIDAAKGTLIQQKIMVTLPGTTYVAPYLLRNRDGEVKHLMIRHSRWNTGERGGGTRTQRMQSTKKIELYNIANDLTTTATQEYGINEDVVLYNFLTAPNGELITLWLNKNAELVLERFKGEGVDARVVIPFEWDKQTDFSSWMRLNPANPSQVLCYVNYRYKNRMASTIAVDLDSKTSKSFIETVNKEYREKLEDESVSFNSKKANFTPPAFESFRVTGFDFYKDKVVVVREMTIGFQTSSSTLYENHDAIITVLDKDLNPLKHFLIHKSNRTTWLAPSIEIKVDGDALRIVTIDGAGLGSVALYYGEIDLKQLQWSKLAKVTQGKKDSFDPPFRIYNTIWFSNNILVHQDRQAFILKEVTGELRPVTFSN